MKPLVSIIIPCYNAEKWVGAAIQSALSQTWTEIEIIAINDGSKDGTLAAIRAHVGPMVIVVDQGNHGAAAARNAGIRLAKGEYVQFLDADDLLDPEKIANQVELLAQNPGAVATARWGRFTQDPESAVITPSPFFRDLSPLEFMQHYLADGEMMHPAAWLVPMATVRHVGAWNEKLTLNDDGEYFCRVVLASKKLVFAPNSLSLYRSGLPGSLSGKSDRAALESLFRSCELIVARVERADGSSRLDRAITDYFQRLSYEMYPGAPDLSLNAEEIAVKRGGSSLKPSMGKRQAFLALFFGWRTARRLTRAPKS